MLRILYNAGIRLYGMILRMAAFFYPKAARWVKGRKNWDRNLMEASGKFDTWIWVHCASLGEFEQARPVIEGLRKMYPGKGILITFFSPSGYDIRKNYPDADYITYLPLDTPSNASKLLNILHPRLVIFVKYELWLNLLSALRNREIPTILISARITPESSFMKSIFADLYRQAFRNFAHIFTQDQRTRDLLADFSGNPQITVSSDTRYDRSVDTRNSFRPIEEIHRFKGESLCLMAGSTWPRGEKMLFEAWDSLKDELDVVMILAPHEIDRARIEAWKAKYPDETLLFSQFDQLQREHRILWIDNIGMLSRLYAYADVAYVGGGWGTGLHNILEPATFGAPVVFGPQIGKFPEADELIAAGGGFSVENGEQMLMQLRRLLQDDKLRTEIGRINNTFIDDRAGATKMVLDWCENHLSGEEVSPGSGGR